eukprot:TRINITY_DN25829_c0_g1_i2.p1 TRINITY_DN25829_c0_g1~~TRINITY_DN25829_c0_g1_i2.p1  ORF type:complete len:421 (-),score=81.30 TRINITY_DN25829_c0_g1_i2:301-1563(-)
MGKKKNKKVTDGAGGAAGCVTARDTSFLEQQQRLLDECRPNPAASTGGSSGSDARSSCVKRNPAAAQDAVGTRSRLVDDGETSVDAVIRQQQRLLDQASQGGPAVYNASAVQASAASNADVFQVRRVRFGARSNVPVLMQGRNGPCALLAVANGLLLRGTLNLNDDEKALSSEELIHRLATLCETLNAKSMRDDAAFRQGVSQVVERLPKLLDGLLLNCRFSSCVDFEYTLDLGLFDLFGLRLFHAWVCPEVANIACSWNALAEALAVSYEIRMALESDSERSTTPAEDEKLAQGYWLDEWLEETRTQTTPRGIQELATLVNDREVGVFFRNNHFSTIYKHGNDVLCALLTDESFEDVESAVWETIDMDCGVILDASFAPLEVQQRIKMKTQIRPRSILGVATVAVKPRIARAATDGARA